MSDREEFEKRNPVPEDAEWSERKKGYYWRNHSGVSHPFNNDWMIWQEACEWQAAREQEGGCSSEAAWLIADEHMRNYKVRSFPEGYTQRQKDQFSIECCVSELMHLLKGKGFFRTQSQGVPEELRQQARLVRNYSNPDEAFEAIPLRAFECEAISTPAAPQADEWVKCSQRLPRIGQRVILRSKGVVQNYMPTLDQGDIDGFGGGDGYFWCFDDAIGDEDYPLVDFETDEWMPCPQPPEQGVCQKDRCEHGVRHPHPCRDCEDREA